MGFGLSQKTDITSSEVTCHVADYSINVNTFKNESIKNMHADCLCSGDENAQVGDFIIFAQSWLQSYLTYANMQVTKYLCASISSFKK